MRLVVSALLVFALPYFGALADQRGRRKPLLIALTVVAVAATAFLGLVDGTLAALALAALAILAFQSAGAQYDPLLAEVAPPETRARVSGLGTGLGFASVLVALGIFAVIVPEDDSQRAFVPTAALFLVFALPCFLFVSEPRRRKRDAGRAARAALGQVAHAVGLARAHDGVLRFLLARFLAGALAVEAASGAGQLLWVVGPLVGVTLGAVGASDRIFLLRLIPASQRGEFFGLSGLVGKLSTGFGPFVLWSGTIWVATTFFVSIGEAGGSRIAVVALAAACAGGIAVLTPLSDHPRPGSA